MHAIAWRKLQQNPNLRVLLITAETFMRLFVTALKANDTISFKNQMRNVDLLLVDDLHFVLGKEATQEELARRARLAQRQPEADHPVGRPFAVTVREYFGSRAFATAEGRLDRNRADRFRAAAGDSGSKGARRFARTARASCSTRKRRISWRSASPPTRANLKARSIASFMQCGDGARPITIENLNIWLADFLRAYDRRVTIEEIKKKVAEHYGLKVADLESPNRSRSIVRPRQIAMYLARLLTPRSYPEIGRRFGNRDHTTVMHAVETITASDGRRSGVRRRGRAAAFVDPELADRGADQRRSKPGPSAEERSAASLS